MVTYQVKDADWWLLNNTLKQMFGPMGMEFEIFRKRNTNQVGYVCKIPKAEILGEILHNTTLLSTSFKENGVLVETIEIFEFAEHSALALHT